MFVDLVPKVVDEVRTGTYWQLFHPHDLGKRGLREQFCMWTLHHWAGDRRTRLGEVAECVTGVAALVIRVTSRFLETC